MSVSAVVAIPSSWGLSFHDGSRSAAADSFALNDVFVEDEAKLCEDEEAEEDKTPPTVAPSGETRGLAAANDRKVNLMGAVDSSGQLISVSV